jgi:hypothetical protein
MKRFSIALLALATALAITPAAMASTFPASCTGYGPSSTIVSGTDCTGSPWTIDFTTVSFSGPGSPTATLSFNAGSTYTATSLDILFEVYETAGTDIDLVYTVSGPAGYYSVDSSFLLSNPVGSVDENVCSTPASTVGCDSLADTYVILDNTAGYIQKSGVFNTTNGTFYIAKDVTDPGFSEFEDSIESAPEPSSLIMFGTGLLGLAGMLRYKFRKTS